MNFDLNPLIDDLSILDKRSSRTVRLAKVMKWPQRHIINHTSQNLSTQQPTRVIVLKARQLGISTIVEGLQFTLAMLTDNFRGQIVSHESKSNEHLLGMTQSYYDNFTYRSAYQQRNKAANKLGWEPVNSRIGVNTAATLEGGRSQTIHFLHASEVAFWPNATNLMAGLGQAIPRSPFSFVFLESTANGVGNWFQSTWDAAVAGKNDYTPMFFPWQTDPEYTAEAIGIDPIDVSTFDDAERGLYLEFSMCRLGEENISVLSRSMTPEQLSELAGPMTDEEIRSRLAWRRHVIRNDFNGDPKMFLQEYPHRPSVAFLSTGRNIFPVDHLNAVYTPMKYLSGNLLSVGGRLRFSESIGGNLKVYKPPQPGRHYVIGGDPTFSTSGDYACAQILDRRTWEQVAVFRAQIHPGEFGIEMCRLGYWYNEALLAPETNKDGATTIGRILGLDYPEVWQRQAADTNGQGTTNKVGWFTNDRTKIEAIGNLKAAVFDKSIRIHDADTYGELKSYVDLGLGKYGNANGTKNDDTVMALAIAATVNAYESADLMALDPPDLTGLRHQLNDMISRTGTLVGALSGGSDDIDSWS